MEESTLLTIYVDGSSKSAPRRGGVGLIFSWVNEEGHEATSEDSLPFSYEGGSNNQMEIEAAIQALKISMSRQSPAEIGGFRRILISTDSRHVADNFRAALTSWPMRGWTTRDGSPVLHTSQWKELRRLVNRLWRDYHIRVDTEWKPGKKSDRAKRVDKLAKASADSPTKRKLDHARVRRRWSPRAVDKGCIRMRGQVEIVRLVTDKLVGSHSVYRYMYEVVDRNSPDFQSVDYTFSKLLLKAGHCYRVRFNKDAGYPQIEAVLEEFPLESYSKSDYLAGEAGPWTIKNASD